jgi:hypothetical protein
MDVAASASSTPVADAYSPVPGILAERWPSLGRALTRYRQGTAEHFSKMAYDRVEAGLIRLEDRQWLAAEAEDLGLKPFDAQLLIACAIRQWALDREYDPRPSRAAPALSFEHRSWRRVWMRIGIVVGFVAVVETMVLWRWIQ